MHRQVGPLKFGPDGLARRGVLVRHLVMPGQSDEAESIFRWLAEEVSPDTYVNIMGQYRPESEVGQIAARASRRTTRSTADRDGTRWPGRLTRPGTGLWRFDRRRAA